MTDPAPSPAAGQPSVPNRPMPTLGHGVHWPTIAAEIDRDLQRRLAALRDAVRDNVTEVVEVPPTPSLGATGSSLGVAMHTCVDHCQCDETRCGACADTGHACENHPDRPWGGISDDINGCHCGGAGMPCPECCDPVPQDGSGSIGDAFTPRKFLRPGWPRIYPSAPIPLGPEPDELRAMADDLNAHGGYDETFVAGLLNQVVTGEVAPPPTTTGPVTYESIVEAMNKIGPFSPPPEPIKLTREQIDSLPKAPPRKPWELDPTFGGVPVELVDRVQDSTPYRKRLEQAEAETGLKAIAELPSGAILGDPQWLMDADREFVAHVNDGVDKAAVLDAVVAAAKSLPHQHIWSTTSPVRCVECRRYLRPWWRRTLDRVRRWGQ